MRALWHAIRKNKVESWQFEIRLTHTHQSSLATVGEGLYPILKMPRSTPSTTASVARHSPGAVHPDKIIASNMTLSFQAVKLSAKHICCILDKI